MSLLTASLSRGTTVSTSSRSSLSYRDAPQSPALSSSSNSASSSRVSLDQDDEENVTITASRSLMKTNGKKKSQEDLQLLAISTHMTELSYAISDIQTRIFEIQELRHKSQSSGDTTNTTNVIDQSLMNLDDRLESVEKGMKSISDSLEPFLRNAATPTLAQNGESQENAALLRKHATLMADWTAVQDESDVLREELKEDKWLTVFRTVTDQADGMMSSLEKAVNRCQDLIFQVYRHGGDESQSYSQASLSTSSRHDRSPITFEAYTSLLESFEAKKKHYMPATSKVLSIIDKGVRDRVTKNGETLRRHAESAQRWRNLRERITRTDAEMEVVRKILLSGELSPSENGSSTSGHMSTRNGYLATPPSGSRSSRAPSSTSTLSRSISPFRKFARKLAGTTRAQPVTPLNVTKNNPRAPQSEPVPVHAVRRQRTSLFGPFRGDAQPPPTPERPGHKYSQSLTPDSSPRVPKTDLNSTVKGRPGNVKQPWNSSTKVDDDRALTVKGTAKRSPSAAGMYPRDEDAPPVPPVGTPYRRSVSRASMASSRPWSPITSSVSTTQTHSSSHPVPPLSYRPPSRSQTPSRAVSLGLAAAAAGTPRPRPKTPSHIPAPSKQWRSISGAQSEANWDDEDHSSSIMQRAFSPSLSTTGTPGSAHPPRPPSRSMIPVPSLHLSSPSRPGSAMSNYNRSESPGASAFRSSAVRAQTPESTLRARAQQVPLYQGSVRTPSRPSKLPPSSFRDGSSSRTPSRPSSRTGAHTPSMDGAGPLHEYTPGNLKDPLDVEVALIVNAIPHGLLVERVDPPLRISGSGGVKEGEEIKAQYAFSNTLSRKVVTCRLTTLTRSGKASGDMTTKKVMCRVGGGWQDLSHYILNRQAGM